jgi:hypothetical protein
MIESKRTFEWGLVSVAIAVIAGLAGCKSDEFADAPKAEAPEEAPAEARQPRPGGPGGQPGRGGGSESLPSDHPPIGGARGSQDGRRGAGSAPSRSPSPGSAPGGSGGNLPVEWESPEAWEEVQPSSSMRKAQYRLPGSDGAAPASLAVYYFGAQKGGSVQANIDRWTGQFKGGAEAAETTQRKVEEMTVHMVDVAGTFNPGTGMGSGGPKEDHRMLAAIVETGQGPVFFKLVGPEETVGEHESEFESLVESFQPAS